jgi:non-ribosomal peptide synthetase component F
MTLLAIYGVLLHCHTSGEDLAIGTATSGRNRTETENLIGFFLNTIVIRTRLDGDPSFRELLLRTRESPLNALANDDIPFELVVKNLQPRREGGQNPLFQFLFSLEPPLTPLEPGWKFTQMDVETRAAKFDLHLELDERADCIIGRFLYNTDLFRPETIQLMLQNWCRIIGIVVANPDIRLSGVSRLLKTPAAKPDRATWWGQLWDRGKKGDPRDLPKAPVLLPETPANPKVKR